MSEGLEDLKSLVLQTLETNGVLGQIRAHLRANVYKAIDREECADVPKGPHKLHTSTIGRLLAEIVAEFFEFYGFRHTLSVFLPESNNMIRDRRSRADVATDAGLGSQVVESSEFGESSILEQLVSCSCTDLRKGEDWHSSASSTTASTPPPAPAMEVEKRPVAETLVRPMTNPQAAGSSVERDAFPMPATLGRGAAVLDKERSPPLQDASPTTGREEALGSPPPSPQERTTKPQGKLPSLAPVSGASKASELAPLYLPKVTSPSGSLPLRSDDALFSKEVKDLGTKETKEPAAAGYVASPLGMSQSQSQSANSPQAAKSTSLRSDQSEEAAGDAQSATEDNLEVSLGSNNEESQDLSYAEDAKRLQEIEAQIARLKGPTEAVGISNSGGTAAAAAVGTASATGAENKDSDKSISMSGASVSAQKEKDDLDKSISMSGASISASGESKGIAPPDGSGSLSGGISGGPSQVLPNDESGHDEEVPSEVEEDLGSISGFESNYDEDDAGSGEV